MDENILFWAFRYALGRRTYAVYEVARAIILNAENMRAGTCRLIDREIDAAIESGHAGCSMDVTTWLQVRIAISSALGASNREPKAKLPIEGRSRSKRAVKGTGRGTRQRPTNPTK